MTNIVRRDKRNIGKREANTSAAPGFARIESARDLASLFEEKLPSEVARLRDAHEDFAGVPTSATYRQRLVDIAHHLRDHAGSFGYHLITELCNDLCSFLDTAEASPARQAAVSGLYISAMERVAQFNITGPGGEKARKFINRLRQLATG